MPSTFTFLCGFKGFERTLNSLKQFVNTLNIQLYVDSDNVYVYSAGRSKETVKTNYLVACEKRATRISQAYPVLRKPKLFIWKVFVPYVK